MNSSLALPPASASALSTGRQLAARLASLIGTPFRLTGKTRTDGANARKLVARALELAGELPPPAADSTWRILPPKKKGVPRLLREFIDTYIVTTGSSYNLQVWNRNPSEPTPQIEYLDGTTIRANAVRFIFVRVHPTRQQVRSVIVATPDYIVARFGKFGKPTIKQQLIILPKVRKEILMSSPPLLFYPDIAPMRCAFRSDLVVQSASIHDDPAPHTTVSLDAIYRFARDHLVGTRIEGDATKSRGQQLEKIVACALGYSVSDTDVLIGAYPDIRHQVLEVKVQDGPTVDLGRYSPQFDEPVDRCPGFTTQSVRYLIALTDATTGTCQGVVLCPGKRLADHFVYVADKSFKCQRSIPMAFFDHFDGKSVFNPNYPSLRDRRRMRGRPSD